jgi:hypothetical protein
MAASRKEYRLCLAKASAQLNPSVLVHDHLGQIALAGPAINQADDGCQHDRTLHLIRSISRSHRFQDGFKGEGNGVAGNGKSLRGRLCKIAQIERTAIQT